MKNDALSERLKAAFAKWKRNYFFKTMVSSALSLGVNILFALYNGSLGIRLLSVWHGSICVFYLLLAAIRGTILLTEMNNRVKSETEKICCRQRTFLVSSCMLLLMDLAMILPISLMAVLEKPVNIGPIPAIAMAAYTTWKIIAASVHVRKQRGDRAPVTQLRTINFIDALVSILTLQNTLIMVNRTKADDSGMRTLSAISSAAIYIVIVWITIRMLRKAIAERKG